jgi:hypothetical protein
MSDLQELCRPFPSKYVHKNPSGGGDYVKHHVVNQRLLSIVGPFNFDLVQIIRGMVLGKAPNPNGTSERAKRGTPDLPDAIVGAICRIRCTIDGQPVSVDEVGDCEEPNNWPHDGARLKDAMSDALKRCSMRFGLGLHLWSQEEFFLYDLLIKRVDTATGEITSGGEQTGPPPSAPPAGSQSPPSSGRGRAEKGDRSEGAHASSAVRQQNDQGAGPSTTPPPLSPADDDRHRKRVNAVMSEAGITDDDMRHALIRYATGGATESSRGLSSEQVAGVVTTVQQVKAGEVVIRVALDGSMEFVASEPVVSA